MQRKKNVLLIYEDLYVSVRLCGYEQLKYLSGRGKLKFQHGRDCKITAEQCQWADVVVIVRGVTWLIWKIAQYCKKAGKFVVYVLDDDLLEIPEQMEAARYYRQASVRKRLLWFIQNSDVFASPSRRLLEKYSKLAVRTARIEEPCMKPAEAMHKERYRKKMRIGFAGSLDRLTDVQQILEEALEEFYKKHYKEAELTFMGVKPSVVSRYGLAYYPFEPDYAQYQKIFHRMGWDIGLAPMPDTEFHRGKHYNKYMEYGAIGCVGIYSDAIPYRDVIRDKENGILCGNSKEAWIQALEWCLGHRDQIDRMKANVHDEMAHNYGLSQTAEQLWKTIPELSGFQSRRTCKAPPVALYRKVGWIVRGVEFLARNGLASYGKATGKFKICRR